MLKRMCFVLAILMVHSSASACSDLNGDGVVNVADFLILVDDFGKMVTCSHAQKVQLVIQNQFNDAVWDTSRNAEGVLTITITKKPPLQPPSPPPPPSPPLPPPATDDSAEGDRRALMDLYNATNGDEWVYKKRYWGSDEPIRKWEGVTTNASGRVDTLKLSISSTSGHLPESLGNLTHLRYLLISSGSRGALSGPIPKNLGNLSQLEVLLLGSNSLKGPIPESLGNLSQLKVLELGRNDLKGPIPESLGNLINLTDLGLHANQLSESIPASLGNLSQLEVLHLWGNNLTGPIPASLSNLTNLKTL